MVDPNGRKPEHDSPAVLASWARQYVIVLEFLGTLGILGFVGYRLDLRFGWQPWGLLTGLLAGLAAGLYRMIREGNRLEKK